jgi:hypothetical protein
MYDVYRHLNQPELLLTTPLGSPLPERAQKSLWKFTSRSKDVPQIVVDEIARSGFSVTRRIARPAKPDQ